MHYFEIPLGVLQLILGRLLLCKTIKPHFTSDFIFVCCPMLFISYGFVSKFYIFSVSVFECAKSVAIGNIFT